MKRQLSRRDFLKGSIVVAVGAASASALGGCTSSSTTTDTTDQDTSTDTTVEEEVGTVTLHRGYGAAHGERCFASAVVATAEDGTILAVSLDELQFLDETTEGLEPVPNSDASLGENFAEGVVLASKLVNDDIYSAMLEEEAGATQGWNESMQAVVEYCVGKTASELTGGVDSVSGSTLTDTSNYVAFIGEVAASTDLVSSGEYTGDGSDLEMGRAYYAAHGESAFCDAVSLVQGNAIVATSIDEFQFGDPASGYEGVPNSDAGFGDNFAGDTVLMSKCVNSETYSAAMAERGGATVPYIENIEAIEAYVAGKTISELSSGVDTVSGATLEDTAGYVEAAVLAAESA